MAAFLRELVLAESPSNVPAAQDRAFGLLTEGLAGAGLRSRRIPGRSTGGAILARPETRNRGSFQLLLGHVDTVWPLGTLAEMPVESDGEVLRGPGSFDMKGGLTQAVFALQALRELGMPPALTPVFLISSDEEMGSPESARHVRRLARRADRAFVLEPALGPEGRLKTVRKGALRFQVGVRGKSAHGGLSPGTGASAVLELSHLIQLLYALEDPERGITVNVGRVRGGSRPNVVAAEARADVDIRVRTPEDARRIEAAVRSLRASTPGTELLVRGGLGRPPLVRTQRNAALWEAARTAGRRLGIELQEGEAGGVSDGNLASLHAATLDGLGAVGDGAHAVHEFVFLDRMPERAALLALLLRLPSIS